MRVPVLMYHKVAPLNPATKIPGHYVSPKLFAQQMRLLKAMKYEVVPLTEMFSGTGPRKRVVITLDDGYENYYTEALPILNKYDYPATVFLVSNQIGGANKWDSAEGDVEERLMTHAQILEAAERGTDFGSHTADHADLPAVGIEEARRQIVGSRRDLERDLNLPISTFCYPYGRKSPETENLVAAAGYVLACSTEKGANTEDTNPMALKRINVRRETTAPIFLYKLWRSVVLGK